MIVTVNGEPVDCTLQGEQTVEEVLEAFTRWLEERDLAVASATVNGEPAFLGGSSGLQCALSDVEKIEISAVSPQEKAHQDLLTVLNFHRLVLSALRRSKAPLLKELREEYPYVERFWPTFTGVTAIESTLIHDGVPLVKKILAGDPHEFSPDLRAEADEKISRIIVLLEKRIEEKLDPEAVFQKNFSSLLECRPNLLRVPLLFQTGKTGEALSEITSFTEQLETTNGQLQRMNSAAGPLAQKWAAFTAELHSHLASLLDSLESGDYVLTGDLLEYEILPLLEEFTPILKKAHFTVKPIDD